MLTRALILFLSWISILLLPFPVTAGSFRAVPIHILLDQKTKTVAIRVTNDGEERLILQVENFRWDQDEGGEDIYEPTEDLVFFPKMLRLEKGEERIVRVGYMGKKAEPVERTYRIYLQELPASKPEEGTIKIALRMGLPVFIKPIKEIHEKKIEGLEFSGNVLKIRIKNGGNSHEMVQKISVHGLGNSGEKIFSKDVGGWYVLVGRTRTFVLNIPRADCLRAQKLKVVVQSGGPPLEGSLELKPDMCQERDKDSVETEP